MSGLVKNQIAKQLARFTKNLSPNKISVKFLKGEGELHNLELDETTLSELLELPPWIRLTKAVCNKISAKIRWTRLNIDPICLYLDRVEVNMEAIDGDVNMPPPGSPQTHPANPPSAKEKAPNSYGFVEKVVDGMFVQINSVIISFKFQAFLATFEMSCLCIQSTTPHWQRDDLRMTRVKDETRGEVLTFKEIKWHALRISANALYDEKSTEQSTPLRLVTKQSALHITIKKRLEDCAVLSARLELLLDDISWVLTQSQLQALAGLLHSVTQAMSRTAEKERPGANSGQPGGQATQQQTHYAGSTRHEQKSEYESLNALFTEHDVRETCYHVRTGNINLHLFDDSEQSVGDGGAMLLQMNKLSVDYYPYHLAGTSRTDWCSHNEASLTRAYWVKQLLNTFRNSQESKPLQPEQRPSKTRHQARSDNSLVGVNGKEGSSLPSSPLHSTPLSPHTNSRKPSSSSTSTPSRSGKSAYSIKSNLQRPVFMCESCFLVRCEEFFIMPVTTSTSNVSKEETAFLSSDKKALYLPSDMPAFQLDFTQYYYPGSIGSAVPCPNLFIQLNPIQLTVDTATCLWFNKFMQSILGQRTWSFGTPHQSYPPSSHIDIRIEALMPKIIIPCPSEPSAAYNDSRPQALQIQISQVFITNSRTGYKCTQTDMLMFLQPFLDSKIYTEFENFPSMLGDVQPLPNSSWVNDYSLLANSVKVDKHLNGVCQDTFGTHQPSQVWCISAEQVWLDFLGIEEVKKRPMPFIDAVPVQIWIATPLPTDDHNTTGVQSAVTRAQSASRLYSPPLRPRSSSGLVSPKRKASEPVLTTKNRSHTTAPSLLSTASSGLCNSDPNMNPHASEALASRSLEDGPTPAYEPRNESHKTAPVVGEPPPACETLTHNGPSLPWVPLEEAPPLPEKVPTPENTLNGLSETDGHANQLLNLESRADVSFLIHIPQCVSVQLDHFQFIFLLRLQEMLIKLQEDLEKHKATQSNEASGVNQPADDQPALYFSILTPGVDFNIVLPPAPDSDVSRLERHPSQNTSRNASSLSSYLDTGGVLDSGCQSPEVLDFKTPSRTDSEDAPRKDGSVSFENHNPKASQELMPSSRPSSGQSASHTSGRASAASAPDSDGWLVVPVGDKSTAGLPQSRTDSDASNFSSQLDGSSMSKTTSTDKDSEKDHQEPKMVSILSIEGGEVEVGIHLRGYDKVVKMVCPEIKLEELGVINFDKYLNQKSFRRSLTKSTVPLVAEGATMVRIRAEFGPSAERNEPTAGERGFMQAKVNGVNGTLLVSTLSSLADCIEDEVFVPPMPFLLEVNNSRVSINNDLPPTLVSAPLAIPVDLSVENVSVRRTHDGVFHIRPLSSDDSQGRENEQAAMPMTRQESINASQLSLCDSASVCSRAESLENEKQCLVEKMAASRATVQLLRDEREALLKIIERLQQELSFSNREHDLLQERMTSFQKGGRRGHR